MLIRNCRILRKRFQFGDLSTKKKKKILQCRKKEGNNLISLRTAEKIVHPEWCTDGHRRCSHRTAFEPQAGFFVILSKEMSLSYEIEEKEKRETVQK